MQRLGLNRIAWKSVQNSARFTVRTSEAIPNHGNRHVIWNQFAFIDKRFGELAKFSLILHVLAKQLAGRNMDEAGLFGKDFCLCTLAHAWRPKKNNIGCHDYPLYL